MVAATSARSAVVGDLPTEVISDAFSRLCPHCCGTSYNASDDDGQVNVQCLIALTQTSSRFRSVALPILFHSLGPHLSSPLIFSLLDYEQTLAQWTKTLHLPVSQDSTARNRQVLALISNALVPGVHSHPSFWEPPQNTETSLLLALCSNIERLKIDLSGSGVMRDKITISFLSHLLEQRMSVSSYSNLRYLEINTSGCRRFSITGPELSLLLRESPKLETLILRGTEGNRQPDEDPEFDVQKIEPALQNLADLQILEWSFHAATSDSHALKEILKTSINLKSFKLVTHDRGTWGEPPVPFLHVTPRAFIQLLQPLQALQKLSLDFSTRLYTTLQNYQDLEGTFIPPPQISQFANLQSLELSLTCYCRHLFGRERIGDSFDQKTCLTEILPPTVRNLTIFFNKVRASQCFDDVLYLGQRTLAGDFPRLESIQVDLPIHYQMPCTSGWDDQWDNEQLSKMSQDIEERRQIFKEAFAGSSVSTKLRAWYVWEDMY